MADPLEASASDRIGAFHPADRKRGLRFAPRSSMGEIFALAFIAGVLESLEMSQ